MSSLRNYLLRLSRFVIPPENPTASHLKNLNFPSNRVKMKMLSIKNLIRVISLFRLIRLYTLAESELFLLIVKRKSFTCLRKLKMRVSTINYTSLVVNLKFFMFSQKIQKIFFDGFPVLGPITSAFRTPTYKIVKFFVQLLKDLTSNHYIIQNMFNFFSIKF